VSQLVTDRFAEYRAPRVAPDGKRVAVDMVDERGWNVWVLGLDEGILTRLTTEQVHYAVQPVWTPDGAGIVYSSRRSDSMVDILWRAADFSGDAVEIHRFEYDGAQASFSPSGELAYYELHPAEQRNILVLPPDGGSPRYVVRTPYNERAPMVSPDGRWFAYVSDRSGRDEVYVEAFPDGGRFQKISDEGGSEPQWAPDGRELFYRNGVEMIAVPVTTNPSFAITGERQHLFSNSGYLRMPIVSNYDVHPDGQRFLMVEAIGGERINIVLNWFEELKRLR
jgi:Tol biopolymer transport system component